MTQPLREDDDQTGAAAPGSEARDDTHHADPNGPGPGMPPPTAVESLVGALLEAGPEVAEHVVRAAQELLLAVQAIVDAADRAVKEQQTVRATRTATSDDDAPTTEPADDSAPAPEPGSGSNASIHHLDLAE